MRIPPSDIIYYNICVVFYCQSVRAVANLLIFSGIWLMIGADNRLTIKVLFFYCQLCFC